MAAAFDITNALEATDRVAPCNSTVQLRDGVM
jgi:hypothetical protein